MKESGFIFLALIMAWAFERVTLIITAGNLGQPYNGFGCIDAVNKRLTFAPMAYRVLIPWMIWIWEKFLVITKSKDETIKKTRITWYSVFRILLTALAFWAVMTAWDIKTGLVLVVLLLPTIKFDYWDYAGEITGLALAMTGNLALALPGVVIHGLSRETVLLAPVAYYLKTGDMLGSVGLLCAGTVVLVLVRLWAGKRPLYCDRWMIKTNWHNFKQFWKYWPLHTSDMVITLGYSLFMVLILCNIVNNNQNLDPTYVIPLVIFGTGWVMARADETRVFSAALPWLAAWIVRGI